MDKSLINFKNLGIKYRKKSPFFPIVQQFQHFFIDKINSRETTLYLRKYIVFYSYPFINLENIAIGNFLKINAEVVHRNLLRGVNRAREKKGKVKGCCKPLLFVKDIMLKG